MDLFTTYIQTDKDEKLADLIYNPSKKVLDELPFSDEYKNGKTSFGHLNIWRKYENHFSPLYDFIVKNANEYCKKMQVTNIKEIIINDIWVSEMYKYGSHSLHNHTGFTHLSGSFYVHAEPNSSSIKFHRHEHGSDTLSNLHFKDYDKYNSFIWRFAPEKGSLLIWKSDLPHEVELNMSNSRITISFNLTVNCK